MSVPARTPSAPSRRDASALGRRALVALHERLLEPLGVTYCGAEPTSRASSRSRTRCASGAARRRRIARSSGG
ncbi:hypothetical protein AES38_03430 [Clavibacter capsici]|nr:hypothetical protein AES38_03430 [Clavibacter capsici]